MMPTSSGAELRTRTSEAEKWASSAGSKGCRVRTTLAAMSLVPGRRPLSPAGRWVVLAVAGLVLTACGAAPDPAPSPTTAASSPTPSTPAASSPAPSARVGTGLTLRQLGFENGPLDEFSLPRDLVLTTSVDQPNVVTIVLASPSPGTVEDYLRSTLPAAGFRIDARAAAGAAMTFRGHGWSGGFTGTGASSAIVLRPA